MYCRAITEISTDPNEVAKCQGCGVVQVLETCPQLSSIRMAVRGNAEGELLWFTVFEPILTTVIGDEDDVTLESAEEDIYRVLFSRLVNFTILYQGQKVKEIRV